MNAAELRIKVVRGGEVPLGAQLSGAIRERVADGALAPGERLPSVRDLADYAGVNVNTVRAVYRRLEGEGLVRSEHGRGTFVAAPERAGSRGELRRQIAVLESELARRGTDAVAATGWDPPAGTGARLPTADELAAIRDGLVARLEQLDSARDEVLRSLAALDETGWEPAPGADEDSSSATLRGARVRWTTG